MALLLVNGTIMFSLIPKIKSEGKIAELNNTFTTTSKVNVRLDNTTDSYRIGGINKDENVEVLITIDDEWDLIRYKNTIGFVNREFLNGIVDPNFDSNISLIGGYVTTTDGVRLRLGPGTDNKIIGNLQAEETVEVIGITENNWFIVRTNNKIGFISGEHCIYKTSLEENNQTNENSEQSYDIYIYPTSRLNFRKEPDKDSERLDSLAKGTPLKLISFFTSGWFQVEYNGEVGYVSADYISFNNGEEYRNDIEKVVCAKTKLNLRSEPNTESEAYYIMNKYETAEVLHTDGDWYLVRVGGNMLGYIKSEYTEPLTDKFVVVDISSQTLTLYDNNTIILETPVVTGKLGTYDTPTGKYEIKRKTTDTYLSGIDYYTHVDYWMPFNGEIGLHDAGWRRKFGGNIYVNDGSHGCVNIPSQYADDVFENVSKGTKVLVQQ